MYQMAAKESSLALGMVSLFVHFRWNWVGLVISEDENGVNFVTDLIPQMERNTVCVAFMEFIPVTHMMDLDNAYEYHIRIMRYPAKVVIV